MNEVATCTKCKRKIKNITYVGGSPYGPVCVLSTGYVKPETVRIKKLPQTLLDESRGQLNIFEETL